MKIEEHLSASLVVALKSLYGATIEEKQIQLQKLDLGTNPINISSSNEFLNINHIMS